MGTLGSMTELTQRRRPRQRASVPMTQSRARWFNAPLRTLLIGLSLAGLAACGGQPFDSTSSAPGAVAPSDGVNPPTRSDGSLACDSLTQPAVSYDWGYCGAGSRMATVFRLTGASITPLVTDFSTASYRLQVASTLTADLQSVYPLGATDRAANDRSGAVSGLRLRRTLTGTGLDAAAAIEVTDYHQATQGSVVSTVSAGSFGTWSSVLHSYEGYQGVWFSPLGDQSQVRIPTTGSQTLSGVAVGFIGPADQTSTAQDAVIHTVSAQMSITINYATGAISGTLGSFMSGGSGAEPVASGIVNLPITGTQDLASPLLLSGALVAAATGAAAGTGDGALEGRLVGTGTALVSQVIGRLKFNTTDNRRAVLAFGLK